MTELSLPGTTPIVAFVHHGDGVLQPCSSVWARKPASMNPGHAPITVKPASEAGTELSPGTRRHPAHRPGQGRLEMRTGSSGPDLDVPAVIITACIRAEVSAGKG